jgi:hypothetical protein
MTVLGNFIGGFTKNFKKLIQHSNVALNIINQHQKSYRSGIQFNWKEPTEFCYKVNWDAAVNKVIGRLRIGIVAWDHKEYVHAARSMTRLGHL